MSMFLFFLTTRVDTTIAGLLYRRRLLGSVARIYSIMVFPYDPAIIFM